MITKVTVTGADDSIDPVELIKLSIEFPFVEWGILMSKKHYGEPRYPSHDWLQKLHGAKVDYKPLALSLHLCGQYVREFVKGDDSHIVNINQPNPHGSLFECFDRVQLNFHAMPHESMGTLIDLLDKYERHEFIFQHDGVNDAIVRECYNRACYNIAVLYDKSGGAGILPKEGWPDLLDIDLTCGYAGGLSPENVAEQITLIEAKAGIEETWIDVETHVRSGMDQQFDLTKVRQFLQVCANHINGVKAA